MDTSCQGRRSDASDTTPHRNASALAGAWLEESADFLRYLESPTCELQVAFSSSVSAEVKCCCDLSDQSFLLIIRGN